MDLSIKSNSSNISLPCNLSKVTFRKQRKRKKRSSDTKDDSLKDRSNSMISEKKSETFSNRQLNAIPEESLEKDLYENLNVDSHELPLVKLNNRVINQGNNNKTLKKIKHHKSKKKDDTPIDIFKNTEAGMEHPEKMLTVEPVLHLGKTKKKKKLVSDDIQGSTVDNSKFWEKCTKTKQEFDNENGTSCDKSFKTKAQHKHKEKFNIYEVSGTEDDSKQVNNESFLGESFNRPMSLDSKPLQDRLTLIDDIQENTVDNSELWVKCTKRRREDDNENSTNCDTSLKTKAQHKHKKKFNIYEVSGTEDDSEQLNNESFLGKSFNMSLDNKPLQDRLTLTVKSDNQGSVNFSESSHKKKKSKKRLKSENEELFNKTNCASFLLEGKGSQINKILTPYNSTIDKDKAESKSENCRTETDHNDLTLSVSAPFNIQEDVRELENKMKDFKTKVKHKHKKHFETESLQGRLSKTEKSDNNYTLEYYENIPKKKSKKKHKNKEFSNNTDSLLRSFPREGNEPQINNNVMSCSSKNQNKSKLPADNFMTGTDHNDLIPSGSAPFSLNLSNTQKDGELGHKIQTFKPKCKYKNKTKNECQMVCTKDGLEHLQNETFLEDDSNFYSESNALKDRLNQIEESDKQMKFKSEMVPKMKKSKKKLTTSDEVLNNNILTPFTSTINEGKAKLRSPERNVVSGPNIMEADLLSGSSQPNLSESDVCVKKQKNRAADLKKVCQIKLGNNKIVKSLDRNLNIEKLPRKNKLLVKGTDVDKLRYQILEKYMKKVKGKNLNPSVNKPKQKLDKVKSNKKGKSNLARLGGGTTVPPDDIDMIRQQLISRAFKSACSSTSKSSDIKTNVSVNPTQRALPNAKSTIAPQYDTSKFLLKSGDTKIQPVREELANTQQTFSTALKNLNPKSSGRNISHCKAEVKDNKSIIKGRSVDKVNGKKVHNDKTNKYVPSKKDEKTKTLSVEDMTSQLLAQVLAKVQK